MAKTQLSLTENNAEYLITFLADYAINNLIQLPKEAQEQLCEILNIIVPGKNLENVNWELINKSID